MLKRDLLANYFGYAWSALMSMAFLPLYIKYLGIEAYGLIGVYLSLQGWFALLDMGFSPTLNREMTRYTAGLRTTQSINDLLRSMEIVFLGCGLLVVVLMGGLASWIATDWLTFNSLSTQAVTGALAITGIIIGLRWMVTLYRSALFGLQIQVWLNIENAIFATIRGAGTLVVLLYISPTIKAFFIFQALATALEVLVLYIKVHTLVSTKSETPRFSLQALKSIGGFAGGVTVIILLATLMTQVDKVLLSKLLTLEQFGYLTLATTIASTLASLTVPVSNVAFPRFSKLIADNDEAGLSKQYHQLAQLLSISILPSAVFISVFSREILLLWTNQATLSDNVAPILTIWILGAALANIMSLPYYVQIAAGWTKLTIISNAVAVIGMVPALWFFAPRYGAVAAAWIWFSLNAGFVLFSVPIMHLRILKNQALMWYRNDFLLPLIGAITVVFIFKFLFRAYPGLYASLPLPLLVVGFLFAILAAAFTTREGRNGLRRLARIQVRYG